MHKNTVITAGAAAAVAAGLALGGSALARADQGSTTAATATATPTASPTSSGKATTPGGVGRGGDKAGREAARMARMARLLSGDTAVKVTQAATAKEPTAKLEFVGSDPAGGYVARMVRTDGTHLVLKIDAAFAVTSDQVAPARPRHEERLREAPDTPGQAPSPSGSPTSGSSPSA